MQVIVFFSFTHLFWYSDVDLSPGHNEYTLNITCAKFICPRSVYNYYICVYYAVFTVEFFTAAHIFYTLWLLYGNETVPWFDAVIRMERKTNRHRKRACLVQCFCGANYKLAKREGRKVSGVRGG